MQNEKIEIFFDRIANAFSPRGILIDLMYIFGIVVMITLLLPAIHMMFMNIDTYWPSVSVEIKSVVHQLFVNMDLFAKQTAHDLMAMPFIFWVAIVAIFFHKNKKAKNCLAKVVGDILQTMTWKIFSAWHMKWAPLLWSFIIQSIVVIGITSDMKNRTDVNFADFFFLVVSIFIFAAFNVAVYKKIKEKENLNNFIQKKIDEGEIVSG